MIKTFKTRSIKKLYEGDASKVNADHIERVEDILALLDSLESIDELKLKGLNLHKLSGNLKGFWSISVSGNYRIWFRFEDNNVFDVSYGDYH
jgi:proteic killer suppression protein